MMRPGHGDDFRHVLALVSFPQKRVALLNAPLPRRLAARDVEVQMRPAAAASFLAKHTDLLSHADLRTGPHRRIDDLQMAVAVEPPAAVEQINDIVTRLRRTIVIARQNLGPRRNHTP